MKSAEEWLKQKGVERQPLIVRPEPGDLAPVDTVVDLTEPRPIESAMVAEAAEDEREHLAALAAAEPRQHDTLADDVARAVAYIRNATSMTPISEGRLRDKLVKREYPEPVVRLALEQARKERLVDDVAFASALVDESLAKGHAPRRIRDDLFKRGFDKDLVLEVLARTESSDPEAAAFAVARDRADALSSLSPETAYRRLVAYLARRGHPEGLARKVARQVLWVEREQERAAGR